ncbi:hypothetical protein B0H14DRAFT_2573654 [Mycena olivaceomarginata]|nr:hypothetical protein B0H14DRAFT_2573654 [Mycena olivaceomarginata]
MFDLNYLWVDQNDFLIWCFITGRNTKGRRCDLLLSVMVGVAAVGHWMTRVDAREITLMGRQLAQPVEEEKIAIEADEEEDDAGYGERDEFMITFLLVQIDGMQALAGVVNAKGGFAIEIIRLAGDTNMRKWTFDPRRLPEGFQVPEGEGTAPDGKVRFGSGSGYFSPNAEPELRFRFRDLLNLEPELQVQVQTVRFSVRTSSNA